ncbi:hypothetical protein ABFX02_06G096700 [Erythranthe guttata]
MSSNAANTTGNLSASRQPLVNDRFVKIFVYGMYTSLAAFGVCMVVSFIILYPKNPRFALKDAEIYDLQLTATPPSINSTVHLTIIFINPNKKAGIYYSDLVVYTSYKGEMVIPEAPIAPFYMDHGETSPLSVSLVGKQQLVGPALASQFQQDRENGKMELEFKVTGNMKFKDEKYWYPFTVKCPALMKFERKTPLSSTTQGNVCSVKF